MALVAMVLKCPCITVLVPICHMPHQWCHLMGLNYVYISVFSENCVSKKHHNGVDITWHSVFKVKLVFQISGCYSFWEVLWMFDIKFETKFGTNIARIFYFPCFDKSSDKPGTDKPMCSDFQKASNLRHFLWSLSWKKHTEWKINLKFKPFKSIRCKVSR